MVAGGRSGEPDEAAINGYLVSYFSLGIFLTCDFLR